MKKVTAMLFSMAVGLNAVSMAAKAKATEEQETDVLLIGGGIMSATLGTYLQELEPGWSMTMVERLDGVAQESSIFSCRTVGLVWNSALHIPLSKSRIQVVSAECRAMTEVQCVHEACDALFSFFLKHI